jgi:protein DGCR14
MMRALVKSGVKDYGKTTKDVRTIVATTVAFLASCPTRTLSFREQDLLCVCIKAPLRDREVFTNKTFWM